MNTRYYNILRYLHAVLAIALAAFFISKGLDKFGAVKLRDKHIRQENTAAIVQKIIVEQNYEAPYGYDITMNTMRQSGFMKFIGLFQIIAGALMFLPQTRMAGLLLLLPIILNIFLMHVFFDNRAHENIETGRLLGVNIVLLLFYYKELAALVWQKKKKFY